MGKYILVINPQSEKPDIVRDSSGLLQWFATEQEAHEYAFAHTIEEYEIYSLSQPDESL